MARGSDPDSRPISVAELMARAQEQGATDVADAAANSPAATGRRHRGGKDAVSVAELTGEIPRIDESSTPPPTRDFNSDTSGAQVPSDRRTSAQPAQEDRTSTKNRPQSDLSAEETTGVIAPVQAYSQVDENHDDDHRALSAAEREREFERYRNFEDVDAESEAPAPPKKRKRGVFGLGRKKDTTEAPAPEQSAQAAQAEQERRDDTDHDVTQLIPVDNASASPKVVSTDDAADTGRYLRFDDEAWDPTPRSEVVEAGASKVDITKSEPAQSDTRGFDAGDQQSTVAAPIVAPPDQDTDAVRTRLTESAATRTDSGTDSEVADKKHESSPGLQWLMLIGQVVAGLAVGVALFWGFTELWRWNVYFALVLAVAVIFGLVTLVHVVRRSQDLISTLLALGVGLLVTIGPLVLLLVAGD